MNTETINDNLDEIYIELRDIIIKLFVDGKWHYQDYLVFVKHVYSFSSRNFIDTTDGNYVSGEYIYEVIKDILRFYLNEMKRIVLDNASEDLILMFVATKWKLYKKASTLLNHACSHLNHNWIAGSRHVDGRLNIYQIYHLAYVLWKNIILQHFYIRAIKGALKLIERQRNGLSVDSSLVSALVDCLVTVDINEDESINLTFYKTKFECLYLKDTERYYNEEGTNYLQNNSISEYMKIVERRLGEEQKRLKKNLHGIGNKMLTKICDRSLIQRHLQAFADEFKRLLILNQNEDIKRMYLLVARNPTDLLRFKKSFFKHVLSQGLAAIKENCEPESNDAKKYATTVLTVYKKYCALVSDVFKNNDDFYFALKRACAQFINRNEIVSSTESSQFFAQYCNILLRKSDQTMEISELEDNFKSVLYLYQQLQEKDSFESLYLELFKKRLIENTSSGYDAESLMISTMESKRLFTKYTKDLRRIQDEIQMSESLSKEFQTFLIDSSISVDIDLNFKVLSSFLWKINQLYTIRLPDQIEIYSTKFIKFYTERNLTKKLNVCHQLCNGEVLTNHYRKRYTLQCNAVQISVLLLYNISLSWTLSDLINQLQIEMEYLLPSLKELIKNSILICSDFKENLNPNSVILLNEDYTNSKRNVTLNVSITEDIQKTANDNVSYSKLHRNTIIQLRIMRVLKKHRIMKQEELIDEVSKRISFFTLNKQNFMECMNILIRKEYVERSDAVNTYKYVP